MEQLEIKKPRKTPVIVKPADKKKAVAEFRAGGDIHQIASKYGVVDRTIYAWCARYPAIKTRPITYSSPGEFKEVLRNELSSHDDMKSLRLRIDRHEVELQEAEMWLRILVIIGLIGMCAVGIYWMVG